MLKRKGGKNGKEKSKLRGLKLGGSFVEKLAGKEGQSE